MAMNYRDGPDAGESTGPLTPGEYLIQADNALADQRSYGPGDPEYTALALTSIAHSLAALVTGEIEERARNASEPEAGGLQHPVRYSDEPLG